MDIEVLDDVAQEPPPPPVMDTILTSIGFEQERTRARLADEGFQSFADVLAMKEKDVHKLADSYGQRTIGDGRAIFGLRKLDTSSDSFIGSRTIRGSVKNPR